MEEAGATTGLGPQQQERLDHLFADELWTEAIHISGEPDKQIRALAQEADMTP